MREFRGDLVLVAVNNGWQEVPAPLAVQIAANSNLPPRIKRLLADGALLQSQLGDDPGLPLQAGRVALQLPGKAAAIYCL